MMKPILIGLVLASLGMGAMGYEDRFDQHHLKLGSDTHFSWTFIPGRPKTFDYDLMPNVEYFVQDRLAIGAGFWWPFDDQQYANGVEVHRHGPKTLGWVAYYLPTEGLIATVLELDMHAQWFFDTYQRGDEQRKLAADHRFSVAPAARFDVLLTPKVNLYLRIGLYGLIHQRSSYLYNVSIDEPLSQSQVSIDEDGWSHGWSEVYGMGLAWNF